MAFGKALHPTTVYELDKGYYDWQDDTTSDDSPCPEYWAPMGNNTLVVYPKMSASKDALLQLLYYKADPRLKTGATYLDLGDEEITRIIDYAQWVLAFKEGIEEAVKNTEPMKQLFLLAANTRAARLKQLAAYKRYMGQARDEAAPSREVPQRLGVRG